MLISPNKAGKSWWLVISGTDDVEGINYFFLMNSFHRESTKSLYKVCIRAFCSCLTIHWNVKRCLSSRKTVNSNHIMLISFPLHTCSHFISREADGWVLFCFPSISRDNWSEKKLFVLAALEGPWASNGIKTLATKSRPEAPLSHL